MATVRTSEARGKFSALLKRVEQGEQFVITRRGKRVARLLPVAETRTAEVSVAMEKLRELREGTSFASREWKDLRDAGRKF